MMHHNHSYSKTPNELLQCMLLIAVAEYIHQGQHVPHQTNQALVQNSGMCDTHDYIHSKRKACITACLRLLQRTSVKRLFAEQLTEQCAAS